MNLKKTFISVAAVTLVAGLGMAIDWSKLDNFAKDTPVVVSSKNTAAATITDGNDGTSWQAIPSTHSVTDDWALIDLGEVKDFNTIEIKWEASHPSKYSVYVSENPIPYTLAEMNVRTEENPEMVECGIIDGDWLEAATPAVESTLTGEANYTDALSVEGHGRYVLIYTNAYNNNARNYGIRIFEVRIANVEGQDKVSALQLNDARVTEGDSVNITVQPINVLGETLPVDKVTDLALTCSDPSAVEIKAEENVFTVKALKSGTYTLTATAIAGDVEVTGSAALTVEYNWETVEKIDLTGCAIKGRYKDDLEVPHPAASAIDGDLDTYYEYNGGWGGGEGWLLIDLGKDYMIDGVGIVFGNNSRGKTKISHAVEIDDAEGNLDNTDFKWTNDNAVSGFTSTSSLSRENNSTLTYAYPKAVRARFVAIRDTDNPAGKPQIKEVYLKGEEYQQPVATSIEVTVDPVGMFVGETAEVNVTVYDQYEEVFTPAVSPMVTVEGADYADGQLTGTVKGVVNVTASYGELSAQTSIKVADVNDYCMGKAVVTSDTTMSEPYAAFDGGSDPTAHGAIYVITDNETSGEHTHWIMADLHKPYNLDMIIAIWEGACPADYDLYVGKTEDDLQQLYSVTGHTQKTWYDRFCGKEMNEVQFIKIVTTRNATGYGIKLFDLKAYGVPTYESVPTEISLSVDENHFSTDESIPVTTVVIDQYGDEMEDAGIEYTTQEGASVEDGLFKATKEGVYTLTAKCGDIETEPVEIHIAATGDTKLTPAHTAILSGTPYNGDAMATEVQFDVNQPLEITFDKANYDFTLIRLRWEAACPSHYKVEATYEDGSKATVFSVEDRAFVTGFDPTDRIVHDEAGDAENGIQRVHAYDKGYLKGVKKLTVIPTAKDHEYTLRLFGIDTYGIAHPENTEGVEGIENDNNTGTIYYDLQGIRVMNPQNGGIYIVDGKKKIIINTK